MSVVRFSRVDQRIEAEIQSILRDNSLESHHQNPTMWTLDDVSKHLD